ncbi:MAG: hypothetical protein WD691_04520 [Acidimicrobiales bacterium]
MDRSSTTHRRQDPMIDLATVPEMPIAHRLGELVQALTGCSIERAELAVNDPTPWGPASSDEALSAVAGAMVRLRRRRVV